MVKVDPTPSLLLAVISPPNILQKRSGNLQSQPGPTILAGHRSLGLRERLKQFLHLLGVMPIPVSLTLKVIQSAPSTVCRAASNLIVPCSVNLEALPSRLTNPWRTLIQIGIHGAEIIGTMDFKIVGVLFNQRLDGAHHILD